MIYLLIVLLSFRVAVPQSESDAQDGGVIQETDEIITKKKKRLYVRMPRP